MFPADVKADYADVERKLNLVAGSVARNIEAVASAKYFRAKISGPNVGIYAFDHARAYS